MPKTDISHSIMNEKFTSPSFDFFLKASKRGGGGGGEGALDRERESGWLKNLYERTRLQHFKRRKRVNE